MIDVEKTRSVLDQIAHAKDPVGIGARTRIGQRWNLD